jgi:hypothetical protein
MAERMPVPRSRGVAVWIAFALAGIAVALALLALSENNTAALVRSLVLPGSPKASDTGTADGSATGAAALIAVALAGAVAAFPGRGLFAISAIWAFIALGAGLWTALRPGKGLPIQVGPIALPVQPIAIVLATIAAACVVGCLVGWLAAPSEAATPHPPMPPPTHQA